MGNGWLKLNGTWERRVVVIGSHLLWSKEKKRIDNDEQYKQRKRFGDWVSVMNISDVKKVGKLQFVVTVGGDWRKKWKWTAEDMEDRDDWVEEIQHHIGHMQQMLEDTGFETFMSRLSMKH